MNLLFVPSQFGISPFTASLGERTKNPSRMKDRTVRQLLVYEDRPPVFISLTRAMKKSQSWSRSMRVYPQSRRDGRVGDRRAYLWVRGRSTHHPNLQLPRKANGMDEMTPAPVGISCNSRSHQYRSECEARAYPLPTQSGRMRPLPTSDDANLFGIRAPC